MNHSVKSKTIRHDCHLLVRAERRHPQTLVLPWQRFQSNRRDPDPTPGAAPLPLPPVKIPARKELLVLHHPRRAHPGQGGGTVPPGTAPTARPHSSLGGAASLGRSHRITESQNSRGCQGPLWVTQSNPPAEAGSPTAGCTGPCPGGS